MVADRSAVIEVNGSGSPSATGDFAVSGSAPAIGTLNRNLSFTIVNRHDPLRRMNGTSNNMVDVSGPGLLVNGGSADAEVASVFANTTALATSTFRITGFEDISIGNVHPFSLLPARRPPAVNRKRQRPVQNSTSQVHKTL